MVLRPIVPAEPLGDALVAKQRRPHGKDLQTRILPNVFSTTHEW